MVAGERFLMLSKTEGNSPTLCISRGRVYAHMRAHVQTNRKKHAHIKKLQLCTRKKQIEEPFSTRRNNRTTENLPIFGLYFLKDRSKKHMLRTENIFLHTRNSMKKEDLRRDKEDIRRLKKNA